MFHHNSDSFFSKYFFVYTPHNAALLENAHVELGLVFDFFALLEQKSLLWLLSKKNFKALLGLEHNLVWLTRNCSLLTNDLSLRLLSHKNFRNLLKLNTSLELLHRLLSAMHEKKSYVLINSNSLAVIIDNIHKSFPISQVIRELPRPDRYPYLNDRDMKALCLLSEQDLWAIVDFLNLYNNISSVLTLPAACFKKILHTRETAQSLSIIIKALQKKNSLEWLTPKTIQDICSNLNLRSSLVSVITSLEKYQAIRFLTEKLWKVLLILPERSIGLNQFLHNAIARHQWDWINASLFESIVSCTHTTTQLLINLCHKLSLLYKDFFISAQDLCCSIEQSNIEQVLKVIDRLIERQFDNSLCNTTLPLLLTRTNEELTCTYDLINTLYDNHLISELDPILLKKILLCSSNGLEVLYLIDFMLHHYYAPLSIESLHHIFQEHIFNGNLFNLLKNILQNGFHHIVSNKNLAVICERAFQADTISYVLLQIKSLGLSEFMQADDLMFLASKAEFLLNNISLILKKELTREKRLITPAVLRFLLENYFGPAVFDKACEDLEGWRPRLIDSKRFELIITNQVPIDSLKYLVDFYFHLKKGTANTSADIRLIFEQAIYIRDLVIEIIGLLTQHPNIALDSHMLLDMIKKASQSHYRMQILQHIHTVLPTALNKNIFNFILNSDIPSSDLLYMLKIIPRSCFSLLVLQEIISLELFDFKSLFEVLQRVTQTQSHRLLSPEVLTQLIHEPEKLRMMHNIISISSYPDYSYLVSAHVLRLLQNTQYTYFLTTLMFYTTAAPAGSWINEQEFYKICDLYQHQLPFITNLSYYFYHLSPSLLLQERVMALILASKSQDSSFQWLLMHICQKNLLALLEDQVVFDILTKKFSRIPKLLYRLHTEDIDGRILTAEMICSLHAHESHLNQITPLLLILSSAEAALINPDTCALIMRLKESERLLWAQQQAHESSPEERIDSQNYSLKKLLRLYRSKNVLERGGANLLLNNVKSMVEHLLNSSSLIPWANNLAKHYLEGCVNQPVRGYTEIAAWLFVGRQKTLLLKFNAVKYPMILKYIHKKLSQENTLTQVEVEKANALLREICKKHPEAALWDGTPDTIAYEQTITDWLSHQQLTHELCQELTNARGSEIKTYLLEIDFMSTWACVAFQEEIASIQATNLARKQHFFNLIEEAITTPNFTLSTEHGPVLWPNLSEKQWHEQIQQTVSSHIEPISFIKQHYDLLIKKEELDICEMVLEKTAQIAREFDCCKEGQQVAQEENDPSATLLFSTQIQTSQRKKPEKK